MLTACINQHVRRSSRCSPHFPSCFCSTSSWELPSFLTGGVSVSSSFAPVSLHGFFPVQLLLTSFVRSRFLRKTFERFLRCCDCWSDCFWMIREENVFFFFLVEFYYRFQHYFWWSMWRTFCGPFTLLLVFSSLFVDYMRMRIECFVIIFTFFFFHLFWSLLILY